MEIELIITKEESRKAIKEAKQDVNISLQQNGILLNKKQYAKLIEKLEEIKLIVKD